MAVKTKSRVIGKGELIELVSSKTKLSKKDSEKALNAVLDVIKDSLKKGNAVRLIPFGSFEVRERKARTGRNPQTGAKIHIRARKVPAFRAGKGLKEVVK